MLFILGVAPAYGLTWVELGDAGDLPATAQIPLGAGPLTAIEGSIAHPTDHDMYLILISDPASFSASTNNAGTNLSEDNDTQLFLFDSAGFGVLANDDDPNGVGFESAIPPGFFGGPAGLYYLAISIFANDPVSADGLIFEGFPDEVVGPVGPGGGSPIAGWMLDPSPEQTGPYRIELTGVSFPVPEPGSAILLFAALGAYGWNRWQRLGHEGL
jgi:hypothetical protein